MKRFALLVPTFLLPVLLHAQDVPKTQPVSAMPTSALPLKHDPKPTKSAITADDLMTRLYIFADDSMMGREAGTLGSVKATEYLAAEAKRMGLIPAGDKGTYFQTLPVKMRAIDPMSSVIVGGASLTLNKEWTLIGELPLNASNLDAVYGGQIGDASNELTAEQAHGKLVVLTVPLSNAGVGAALSFDKPLAPATAAAIAVIFPAQAFPRFVGFYGRPSVSVAAGPLDPIRLFISSDAASKLFVKPIAQLQVGDAGAQIAVNALVSLKDNEFPVRNVVGILPGSDPVLKNQYVAIGAHSDHVGFSPVAEHDSMLVFNRIVRPGGAEDQGKRATPAQVEQINTELAELRKTVPARADSINNGADDDGSGSVSVQEIAEYMTSLKVKPKRSTLFVWHVGEEKGLWGSHYFTEHPTVPRDSIVAQLNMDMVGRGYATDQAGVTIDGKNVPGGPDYLQLIGSRRLSTELGDLVEKINVDKNHKFQFDYSMDANGHPMNIYCRSDHYEYAKFGIPVVFFTTGGHSAYHQLTDEPQYIDYAHMTRVASFVSDVAMAVGNAPKRPLVNMPKMDPKGVCKQ